MKRTVSKLLDRTPHEVTPELLKPYTKGRLRRPREAFGCLICGHVFEVGDTYRWVYANGKGSPFRGGNFFICEGCDCPDDEALQKAADVWPNKVILERLRGQ